MNSFPLKGKLAGGFIFFSPLPGEDEPILTNIFQRGWNHQPGYVKSPFECPVNLSWRIGEFFFPCEDGQTTPIWWPA